MSLNNLDNSTFEAGNDEEFVQETIEQSLPVEMDKSDILTASTIPSVQVGDIEDLEIPSLEKPLEGVVTKPSMQPRKPSTFGKISSTHRKRKVAKSRSLAAAAGISRKVKSRKTKGKTHRKRKYHYVKQGRVCKKVMEEYRKNKCRGRRSQKCKPLQRKRKTCKKIIKHKKAMERKSRRMRR